MTGPQKGLTLDDIKVALSDLKAMSPQQGFLLYTTARAEDSGFSFTGPISLDQVLIDLGYLPDPVTSRLGVMTYADRTVAGKKESVKYHPVGDSDPQETGQMEMQTRVDFFGGGPSDAVYDIVKALLDNRHEVAIPPVNRLMNRLHWLKPQENGGYSVDTIRL